MNKREVIIDAAKALFRIGIYLYDKRQKRKEEKENEKRGWRVLFSIIILVTWRRTAEKSAVRFS